MTEVLYCPLCGVRVRPWGEGADLEPFPPSIAGHARSAHGLGLADGLPGYHAMRLAEKLFMNDPKHVASLLLRNLS